MFGKILGRTSNGGKVGSLFVTYLTIYYFHCIFVLFWQWHLFLSGE